LYGLQVDYRSEVILSEAGRMPDLNIPNNAAKPAGFFKTGFSFQNSVNTKFRFTHGNVIELAFGQNKSQHPVPSSQHDMYHATLKTDKWRWSYFTTDAGILINSRMNRLSNFGASHARLFNAVLTGHIDQYPYRQLPDKSETKELLTWLKTNFKEGDFKIDASISFNKQWDEREMGMIEPTSSSFLRNEKLSDLSAGISSNYNYYNYSYNRHRFDFFANYLFTRTTSHVSRMNQPVFDGFRHVHEIVYGLLYNYEYGNYLLIDLKNKHYFSNTAQNYTNIFPSANVSFDFEDFWNDFLWYDYFDEFKLTGSAGRSLGEASLVYRNYSVLTTGMSTATALSSFFEDREIHAQTKKMTPEIVEKYEAGLQTALFNNRMQLSFTYFNHTTRHMIAPRIHAGQYFLQNIGDVRNDGFLANASFSNRRYSRYDFSINFSFGKVKSKVLHVADGYERVALAGFSDAGAYFAKGEPLGVIFGTTYQRTDDGVIVADDNGVPVINPELKRIGDPTPHFTIGISPSLNRGKFKFSFDMEYNKGGDRWNGTKAFMEKTPSKAAEEYIEDASCFRLSQTMLSYNVLNNKNKWVIRDMKIGVAAQNLFVVSPYKGVDPATTLFGYSTGKGLDFFNMPSLRSYHFFVNLRF
jgi:hypothetical protein